MARRKKKNYRLRKSIRRTLGALFMISAIIIAAIPFPDAAATEVAYGTDGSDADRELPDMGTPYSYVKNEDGAIDSLPVVFDNGITNDKFTTAIDDNTYGAYYIRKNSAGKNMLLRQFDFILRNFDSNNYGVIIDYFDTFTEQIIELDPAIVTGYVTVSQSEFDSFFAGTGSTPIVYDLDGVPTERETSFYETFYPDNLKDYTKRYESYKNGKGEKPAALSTIPADMMSGKERAYCWLNNNFDFTLEDVIDKSTKQAANDPSGADSHIYVMKYIGEGTPENTDLENGYAVTGRATIIAVGEDAFNGVKNVTEITFPDDIKYIANKAFRNSFIDRFVIQGATAIGHAAFSGCTDLTEVKIPNVTVIGEDAFYGCNNLKTIDFNTKTTAIMDGAFAECFKLNDVNLSKISSACTVGEAAFFNCGLGQLNMGDSGIVSLGAGAMATTLPGDDQLVSLDLKKARIEKFGEHVFSGRSKLTKVEMPGTFGDENSSATQADRTLPDTMFYGCSALELVVFPEFCGYVMYDTTTHPDGTASSIFTHVLNPEFAVQGPALNAQKQKAFQRTMTWDCRNGLKSYVPYMYTEDGKTYYEVRSGIYLLGLEVNKSDKTATIARCEYVNENVTGDGSLDVPSKVGPYTITKFGDGCFDEIKEDFTSINIPDDTIKSIGDNVFKDCDSLKEVTMGNSVSSIGNSAFESCNNLQSVTIGKNIKSLGNSAFKGCTALQNIMFETPDNPADFPLSAIGTDALETGSLELTLSGVISENYGPFVYAMDPANYVNKDLGIRICYKTPEPSKLTVILDNRNNLPTLVDYPKFEDLDEVIVKELDETGAETGNTIDLMTKYKTGKPLTPREESMINSTLVIDIPAGIKSIDVKGYLTDTSKLTVDDSGKLVSNSANKQVYFNDSKYLSEYENYGLFNGNLSDPSVSENEVRGDDNIIGVIMHTVEYLPTVPNTELDEEQTGGVFYSCENLQRVDLGSAMTDVGSLPFLNCTSLLEVDATKTENFKVENKILYENITEQEDGTPVSGKEIVEVLHTRGLSGDADVNTTADPTLSEVVQIAPGAFMNTNVGSVDLSGTQEALKIIPDDCFKNSKGLVETVLPENIRVIRDGAFENTAENTTVIIRGKEVDIENEAFNINKAIVRTYKDTAAYNAAQGIPNVTVKPLDDTFRVVFYNSITGEIIKTEYVVEGGKAEAPEDDEIPKNKGMKFVKWSTDEYKNVTSDLIVMAIYESDGKDSNGNGNGNGNGGGSNVDGGIDTDGDGIPDEDENGNKLYTLVVTDGTGDGRYAAGTTITITAEGAPSGAGFANWSSTNKDVIFKDSTKPTTTITMPAEDTTVVCNFVGYYRLDVVYGSGSGSYPAGAKVAIEAVDAPQGRSFASWKSSTTDLKIENARKQYTTVTMPKANAKVTATYMDNGSISGNSTSSSKNNTTIMITKPGISNTDKASAYVSGSSDNFIVKISESLEATEEVQKALQNKYPDMTRIKYFAMDISLYDAKGINKITNTEGLKVNITIPIPDALKEYAGNNRVGAVVNGELETLNPKFTTINGVPSITFTATHFSPYTIYVDTGNMVFSDALDSTPKTGDGIHPKWFLSIGLACISIILFTKKDKKYTVKAYS